MATHYTILTESGSGLNAAWSYEDPIPAAAAIAGHIAFYLDQVEVAAEAGEADYAPARAGTD